MPGPASRVPCARRLAALLSVSTLLAFACSEPAPRVYRVGILSGLQFFASTADGFRAAMAERGYVEGRNVTYLIEQTNFEPDRERQILQSFVDRKVDLILSFPTEAAILAKQLGVARGIPVLFANANIEDTNLVQSVRDPGPGISGVRYPGPAVAVQRLELLCALVPKARRVWVPYQAGYPTVAAQLDVLRPAAAAAGVTLDETALESLDALKARLGALASTRQPGFDAILLLSEPLASTPDGFALLSAFASERGLPMGGAFVDESGKGALFSVSTDSEAVGRLAAPLADKIFKGTPPGSIPVVSAEISIAINAGLARHLGLTVPDGLLRRASRVIRRP